MKRGFTVIELLIVLVIVGIFVGLTIPIFTSIGSESLKSSVNSFASTLRGYRETAIVRNMDCTILFDPAQRSFRVWYEQGDTTSYDITFPIGIGSGVSSATPECGGVGPDPDGIQFPANTLVFNAKGYATPGAIYLTNGEETYAIGVAISGRIKVWKWGGAGWF